MRMSLKVCMGTALVMGLTAGDAHAQTWSGVHVGGSLGAGMANKGGSETVTFDTNLDGAFGDTVRTAAGADAFSSGFCPGLATAAVPTAGCADDDDGMAAGARVGYDWQRGAFVFGGLADVARVDVVDHVSAFSTTPAFYSFSRELRSITSFRARAGVAGNRAFVYGTAGVARGMIGQRFTTSNGVNTFVAVNQDEGTPDEDGFVGQGVWGSEVGGGVEVRLVAGLSATAEYVFSRFDNREVSTIRSQGPAPATNPFILINPAGTDLQRTDALRVQTIRFGLSYRF